MSWEAGQAGRSVQGDCGDLTHVAAELSGGCAAGRGASCEQDPSPWTGSRSGNGGLKFSCKSVGYTCLLLSFAAAITLCCLMLSSRTENSVAFSVIPECIERETT